MNTLWPLFRTQCLFFYSNIQRCCWATFLCVTKISLVVHQPGNTGEKNQSDLWLDHTEQPEGWVSSPPDWQTSCVCARKASCDCTFKGVPVSIIMNVLKGIFFISSTENQLAEHQARWKNSQSAKTKWRHRYPLVSHQTHKLPFGVRSGCTTAVKPPK